MADELDIGDLKGSASLEDNISDILKQILVHIESVDASMGKLGQSVESLDEETSKFSLGGLAEMAAGFVTGEAVIEAFKIGIDAVKESTIGMVEHVIDVGNQLFEMSVKTGSTIEGLSGLRYAASQTGVPFEAFGNSLFMMEKNLGATGAAGDKVAGVLDTLGLSLNTLKGESTDQQFIDIAQALSTVEDNATRTNEATVLLGRGAKTMAGLFHESIDDMIKEAEDLGLIMDTKTAAAAHAAEIAWKSLGAQFEAVEMKVGAVVLPGLIALERTASDAFKQIVNSWGDVGKAFADDRIEGTMITIGEGAITATRYFLEFAKGTVTAVKGVGDELFTLADQVVGLSSTIIAFGKAVALTTGNLQLFQSLSDMDKGIDTARTKIAELKAGFDVGAESTRLFLNTAENVAIGMQGHFADAYKAAGAEINKFAKISSDAAKGTATDTDNVIGKTKEQINAEKNLSDAIDHVAIQTGDYQRFLNQVNGSTADAIRWALAHGAAIKDLAVEYNLTDNQAQAFAKEQADQKTILNDTNAVLVFNAKAVVGIGNAWKELGPQVTDITAGVRDKLIALEKTTDAWGNTTIGQLGDIVKMGKQLPPTFDDALKAGQVFYGPTIDNAKDLNVKLGLHLDGLKGLSGAFRDLATVAGGAFADIVKDIGIVITSLETVQKGLDEAAKGINEHNTGETIAGGATAASGAVQGNLAGWSAIQHGSTGQAVMGAAEIAGTDIGTGALLGSFAGPGGTAVGAAIGAVVAGVTIVASWFGRVSQAEKDARAEMEKWTKSVTDNFDATATAQEKLEAGGVAWKEVNIQVRDSYAQLGLTESQALHDVQVANDATHNSAQAVDQAVQAMSTALVVTTNIRTGVNDIATAFKAAGDHIPDDVKASIDALAQMKGLTDDERASLLNLTADVKPNFTSLEQTAQSYGISLAALGPKFEQGHLEEATQKIFNDFTDLTKAGGDVGGVLLGMKGSIQQVVTESLQFGTAIPENMKPLIANLIDAGQLTDDQGKKLKDVSQITFEATPISQTIGDLNTAIENLTHVLSVDLPNAINNIPDHTVQIHAQVDPNLATFQALSPDDVQAGKTARANNTAAIQGGMSVDEANRQFPVPWGFAGGGEIPQGGAGSDVVGPFYATPGEIMLSPMQSKEYRDEGGEGGGKTQNITVTLDGRVIARSTVRHMPEELRIMGVAA